jgi:alpha-tubulin suppressor-like RCC1 family protein
MRTPQHRAFICGLFGVITVLMCLLCSKNTGTNSQNTGLSATLFEPGGKTFAEGVFVKIYKSHSADEKPFLISVTDEKGRFSIKELPDGMYSIFAQKDSLVMFQDSVAVTSRRGNLLNDTLEYPSTILGVVGVEPVHDPNTVTIRVAGTGKTIEVSNTDGTFTITGMPSGASFLILESRIPGYVQTEKEIRIPAHCRDTIHDTLRVSYSGIPFVSGMRLSQDIFSGTIRVSWKKTQCVDFKDYVVYDDPCTAMTLLPEPSHSSIDTFLIDSMFSLLYANLYDTLPRCLKYRVAVRTLAQQVGITTGYTEFQFLPKVYVWTFFTKNALYEGNTFDSVSIDDTIVFSITAKNRTRPLRKLVWHDPQKPDGYIPALMRDTTKKALSDSLRYAFHDTGYHELRAIVTDSAGVDWWDHFFVRTVIDTLAAMAGSDTGVFVGENIHLHGSAYHLFGSIPWWRWKIGESDWRRTSGPDTLFREPLLEQRIACELWITDEDGKNKRDTLNVFTSLKAQNVAAGAFHSLVLKSDGAVWSFGRDDAGQLCDGNKDIRVLPARVMTGVQAMAAGALHTLLLRTDNSLWACGNNSFGQFGDGTTEGRLIPKRIMTDVQSIAAGSYFSCILKKDASLWLCGAVLSNGVAANVSDSFRIPIRIVSDVRSVAAGYNFLLILKNDGTLWTCGNNTYGQLCDSTLGSRNVPAQVMSGVQSVAAGDRHCLIVKNDGTLWTCGNNSDGQLGVASPFNTRMPIQITSNVKSVAAGALHSLIIKTDGSLWGCGRNLYGQLGDGSVQNRASPVLIMDNVQSVAAGYEHTLILKTDGTVWSCGNGNYGQLGIGNLNMRKLPSRAVPYHYYP